MIAVDQAGVQGAPIGDYLNSDSQGTNPEVWRSKQPDGSYAVVLTNPSAQAQSGTADWSVFGVGGNVIVRDLWRKSDLVANANVNGGYQFNGPISFDLGAYQSKFLKVTPLVPVTQYLADSSANTLSGSAVLSNKNTATHGRAAGYMGNGGSITFNKIHVDTAGTYNIGILYFSGESRTGTLSINNGSPIAVTFPSTGSFSTLGTVTQSISLIKGDNSITVSVPPEATTLLTWIRLSCLRGQCNISRMPPD